jgi:ABC-2 type transport system permease protein
MRADTPALSRSVVAIQQALAVAAIQLTLMWRERRVLWLALALLLIAGASVLSGAARLTLQAQERQAVSAEEARRWDSQGTIDPHSAAHVGRAIPAPVRPLAALDPGLTDFLGTSVFIEGHAQNPARHRAVDAGTALSRFQGFSAAWALQVVAPLLIILAGFATLSGDTAREALRQELGTGASAGVLISGRLIALATASLLLVLTMLIISLPGLSIQYGGAADLAALLAMAAAYVLYLLVFCALTVGVSALAGSARTSLVVLLGFWVVSTLLVPRVAPAIAESLYPTPSAPSFRAGVTEEAENGADGHDPADKRLDALRATLMARYRVDNVDDLPLNFRGVALEFAEANSTRVYNRHFDRLHATYQQQDATQRLFGLVSPTLALQSWSRAFAGTDFPAHLAFLRGVEDYRYRLIQALNQEVKLHKAPQGGKHVADIAGITRSVQYRAPQQTLAGTAAAQRGNFVILLAWLMLGCVVVLIAVRKLGRSP